MTDGEIKHSQIIFFIYIGGLSNDSTISKLPKEPWIGKYYAFQIPAYMYAMKAMAKKKTLKITSYDIINEIEIT